MTATAAEDGFVAFGDEGESALMRKSVVKQVQVADYIRLGAPLVLHVTSEDERNTTRYYLAFDHKLSAAQLDSVDQVTEADDRDW